MALNLSQAVKASAAVLLILAIMFTCAGCQITMADGGVVGARLNLGEVGFEFYHETKETSGDAIIRTDVDKGLGRWIGLDYDSDGDGEADQSREPDPGSG